jgi:biopolymer transport protein ExbD
MRIRAHKEPTIQLTSLIDVLFIVIMFLFLTSSFTRLTSVRLQLPKAETSLNTAKESGGFDVVIDRQGDVFIDDRKVDLKAVEKLAREIKEGDFKLRIFADEKATHGRVIEVIDRVRAAGIYNFQIITVR